MEVAMSRIKRDDLVLVISGKDKGKRRKVLRVIPKSNKVVVEHVNVIKRHQKPTQSTKGGIIEREAPLHISKVMPICPKCGKPTRIGHTLLQDGRKVRVCKKCRENFERE